MFRQAPAPIRGVFHAFQVGRHRSDRFFVLMTAKSFNKRDVRYSNSKQKTVRRLLGERVLRVDSR